MKQERPKSPPKKRSSLLPGLRIIGVILGVPLLVLIYQANHSGLSIGQMFEHIFKGARNTDAEESPAKIPHGKKIDFLTPVPIGFPSIDPPGSAASRLWISIRTAFRISSWRTCWPIGSVGSGNSRRESIRSNGSAPCFQPPPM